jgi:sarcosine oxidase subunit gamma
MPDAATRIAPTIESTDWLTAVPPALRFILHGNARAHAAAASVWGVEFATQACRAVVGDGRATLWLGPDEYLLLGVEPDQENVVAEALEQALDGLPHALVNVSHRQIALDVSGPHAATILSGACPLDLDLAAFPVGMCTRTVLAKADVILWRTREDGFHVEAWRSFAAYVTGVLGEIAREFYG